MVMKKRLFYRLYKNWDNLDFINYEAGKVKYQKGEDNMYLESDLLNITINRNMNNIIQMATISGLPYQNIYRSFAKYDLINVFYTDETGTYLIFSGEISNKISQWSKGNYDVSFEFFDKLNILSRVATSYISTGEDTVITTIEQYITTQLELLELDSYITLNYNAGDANFAKVSPSGNLINTLTQIKKRYGLQIYGNEKGELVVSAADILWEENLEVIELDVLLYPATVTISNGYNNINTIIVVGGKDPTNKDKPIDFGLAFDPITYKVNGNKVNYRLEYAYDTFGKTALNRLAINKLLQEQKQFKITISELEFKPNYYELGKLVVIKNHPEIDDQRTFIIEEISHNLSIDGGFMTTLQLSGFSLGYIPDDLLQGTTGLFGIGSSLSILDSDYNFEMRKYTRDT